MGDFTEGWLCIDGRTWHYIHKGMSACGHHVVAGSEWDEHCRDDPAPTVGQGVCTACREIERDFIGPIVRDS